jgi:aspartyl-tRNA(Asn)/glutamyl-tRNA(Gln) amidotransferase subunit A
MDLLSIEEFGRRLRRRQTSAVEATSDCLARIASDNPRLNAFILVMADEALRQAAALDRELAEGADRGPLHGVPVSIKDIFDVAGTPTTAASRVREGHIAERDAVAITRLRRAGAVIVGKNNLHEFAFGTTNEDSAFGPARHPLDPSRSPGGSSGGSAASVLSGMALASLGTDTGGSIRIPAAACGLVGLKPSYDELPCAGVVPLSRTLDHIGPITSSVADGWHMLHALRGHTTVRPLAPTPARSLRLGVPRRYFCDLLDDDVRGAFEQSVSTLSKAGATIVDVDIPHASLIAPAYLHLVFGDAAAFHGPTLDRMPERYTAPVRLRLEMARTILAEDYIRALEARRILRREVDLALAGQDALLLPSLPIVAPAIGASTVAVGSSIEPVRSVMLRLTQLFNLTGHPALSLPSNRTSPGLPCGIQLVGAATQTDTLLHTARGVEVAFAG